MTKPNKTRTASRILARAAFWLWLFSMIPPHYEGAWGWLCHLVMPVLLWAWAWNDPALLLPYANVFALPLMTWLGTGKPFAKIKAVIACYFASICLLFLIAFIYRENLLPHLQFGAWIWAASLLLLGIAAICKLLEPVPDRPDTQPQHD
ncbi:hypothetical protein [Conchiformibius kuhniae]|uniref:Uncharacterized protein n=1 Tax=Conchiformibius kuhniae TaxID=211502 RepID=A0ABD8B8G5_9NEIS|nr:hypothetical protein [Conchiformibius kuhniae]